MYWIQFSSNYRIELSKVHELAFKYSNTSSFYMTNNPDRPKSAPRSSFLNVQKTLLSNFYQLLSAKKYPNKNA